MATLNLTKRWINRWDNGAAVSSQSLPRPDLEHGVTGRVDTFAGGRQRGITQVGTRTRWSFGLRDITLTTKDLLATWLGQTIQVRDNRGQMHVGIFVDLVVVEHKAPTLYDVAIVLRTVTVPEGV